MPDPGVARPFAERRRTVRQRLHTPVYVSFNTPQSGVVVDLSELLDLHEYGFAVQTAIPATLPQADRLQINRAVTLCLDLPETRQYVHGSGQVMWTDDTGRAGIRFSFLPDHSRQALKEWLFANLLVASANHAARENQLLLHRQESRSPDLAVQMNRMLEFAEPEERASEPREPQPIVASAIPQAISALIAPQIANTAAQAVSDQAEMFSALDGARQQIKEMQRRLPESPHSDTDAGLVLQFITERAASLTGASGAALALLTAGKVICRARIGHPAPPLGSEVDAETGLSGECLRTGAFISCADTESDPRVDPEICRRFGIGSFMAAPIFADFRVVGLLEIFSPYPHTFATSLELTLERLAELVPSGESDRRNSGDPGPGKSALETAYPRTYPGSMDSGAVKDEIHEQSSNQGIQNVDEPRPDDHLREDRLADYRLTDERSISAHRSSFSHLVLLGLAIAVAAMALGYLLAPAIMQHVLRRAQAAPTPSSPPVAANGRGHALSPAELHQLAESGDPDAEWQLGILYHDGDALPKDDALAMQWFERAAEQGYVPAQSTLGAYYWAGRGVPQDLSKSYFWSQLAFALGNDENSRSRLEGLSAQMTQAQIASARQQAEAWLRAHNQAANSKSN